MIILEILALLFFLAGLVSAVITIGAVIYLIGWAINQFRV